MARVMKDSGVEWIGEIPNMWTVIPIKEIAKIFGRIGFRGYTTEDLVDKGEGAITLSPTNIVNGKLDLSKCSYLSWEKYNESPEIMLKYNDIVFVKTASVGKCAIYDSYETATINPQFVVFKDIKLNIKFLYYILSSHVVQGPIVLRNLGSVIGTIKQGDILTTKIPYCVIVEQQHIASFLDSKCQEIDNVLAKTRSSIEEYKKLKQAIITKAVTKGIRSNRKMKDSGIKWIGEIPEEWCVSLLKFHLKWKSDKGEPNAEVLSLYRDLGIIPKNSRDDNHNVTSLDTSTYKIVEIGNLVINKMKAWQGSMGISDYRGIISPAYHVCEITNNSLNKKYLHYLLRNQTYLPEYSRLSTGMRIGQWDLGFDDFKNIPFIIPPCDEQSEIVQLLDRKCIQIDGLIAKKEQLISELEAYKKSLIYEYVTGKKEVPMA